MAELMPSNEPVVAETQVTTLPGPIEITTEVKSFTQPLPATSQGPILQGAGGGAPMPAQPALGTSMSSPTGSFYPSQAPLMQNRIEPPRSALNELNQTAVVQAPLAGIEQLAEFNGVRIQQHITPEELAAGIERKQKFSVFGLAWQAGMTECTLVREIFTISEQHGMGATAYLFNKKSFTYIIYNTAGLAVMQFRRKWGRAGGTSMKVYDPAGRLIGTLKKRTNIMNMAPKISVYNTEKTELYWLKLGRLSNDWTHLHIMQSSGKTGKKDEKNGEIFKRRGSGVKRSAFDIDEMDLLFPANCDLNTRALLLGGVVFLDLLWYEKVHSRRDPQ